MIRIVIADDHYLVREGTSRLLEVSGEEKWSPWRTASNSEMQSLG